MTTRTLQAPVLAGPVSFEDFLGAHDGVHAEWVDGEVALMSPGDTPQSRLTRFLGAVIQAGAEEHELGEVFIAPLTVKMLETSARGPDVFYCGRNRCRR